MARKRKEKQPVNAKKQSMLAGSMRYGTYKDVKRKAICLGMPFPDATSADFGTLLSFVEKTNSVPDTSLIDKYDEYIDEQLAAIGYGDKDPLRHSRLRLGYIGETTENGEKRKKRVRGIRKQKEKKPPRERDNFNLIKGTKKSYTFELTEKGYSLERIIRRVIKRFPTAKEKSIKLWHNSAKRSIKKNGEN